MLGPHDPLPPATTRILIAGTSGSGKTTLAGRLSETLGIPHHEMDNLHWGAGWTTRETFAEDVAAFVATEAWVSEFQYREVRPLTAGRAQVMVWLDYPVRTRMWRVLRRTLRRRFRREPMWDVGLLEPPLWTILKNPDHIVRFAWRTRKNFDGLPAALAEKYPHLTLVRLRSPREARRWLERVALAASHDRPEGVGS